MNNKKIKKPNVVRGGIAVPLGRNYYYMSGRTHENGGIDIGKNPDTGLEVEDGEVMHIGNNNIKVFSAQPFLDGESPAEKVMAGDNPNDVFNAQESFKKRNKINDDGTKKKRMGGKTPKRKYTTTLTDDEEKQFQNWYSKVAKYKNLNPNPDADGQDYDYRGYWKNEDRDGILGSNPNAHFTDKYKQPSHPTFSNESQYSSKETPGGQWVKGKGTWLFKHNKFTARQADRTADYLNGTGEGFILGTDTIIPNRKKRMGGLSRNKDYGSKSKPYPKVKAGDFAGGGRSYPIPTKADAVDALRLAELHGRSDVKAKVYKKYPELRQKAKAGGIYSVTSNGETKLHHIPSTGNLTKSVIKRIDNRRRAEAGTIYKLNPNDPLDIIGQINRNFITPNNALSTSKNIVDNNYNNNYSINAPKNTNLIEDGIGLTSNIIGGLISNRINNNMLNNLEFQSAPIPKRAAKLKTRININPQLDKMRENLASYERDIDNNTRSSQVALARKQRARLANILSTNELYGNKENIETELINKDRLNQQEVTNSNIDAYNAYVEAKRNFDNSIIENKANNNIAFLNTINSAVQNTIYNRQKRNAEDKTIATMAFANPNLPIELFYKQGIVSKAVYDAYINAYRKRNK